MRLDAFAAVRDAGETFLRSQGRSTLVASDLWQVSHSGVATFVASVARMLSREGTLEDRSMPNVVKGQVRGEPSGACRAVRSWTFQPRVSNRP